MAAKSITTTKNYIGTAADRAALSTTGLEPGSTFFETDTKILYIWHTAWTLHPSMADYAGLTVNDNVTLTTILLVDAYEPVTIFDTIMPQLFSSAAHATDNITIGASVPYRISIDLSGLSAGNNRTYEFDVFEIAASGSTLTAVTKANPAEVTATAHGFSDGDHVKFASVVGMTELEGQIYVVDSKTDNTFELNDEEGVNINSSGYGAAATAGTIFLATCHTVAHTHRKFGAASDVGSMGAQGFATLTAGNTLELHGKNIDTTDSFTMESGSLSIERL